jgi:hypothetical protein
MIQVVPVKRIVLLALALFGLCQLGQSQSMEKGILTGKVVRWTGTNTVEVLTRRTRTVWKVDKVVKSYGPLTGSDSLVRIGGSTGLAPLPATRTEHRREIGHHETESYDEYVEINGVATGTVRPGALIEWRVWWSRDSTVGQLLPGKVDRKTKP